MTPYQINQKYEMLLEIKSGYFAGTKLTEDQMELSEEDEQFLVEYAQSKINKLMKDPICRKLMDQYYERLWAHRFD